MEELFVQIRDKVLEYFNTKTPGKQPKALVHFGCRDGHLLRLCYLHILRSSSRSLTLSKHPILLIGIESGSELLERAKLTLLGTPHFLIQSTDGVDIRSSLQTQEANLDDCLFITAIFGREYDASGNHITKVAELIGPHGLVLGVGDLSGLSTVLGTCAQNGLYLRSGANVDNQENQVFVFDRQKFKIRSPSLADLPRLLELETQCWPPRLKASEVTLTRRIQKYPEGHFVLVLPGEGIIGVIYSQLIINDLDLETKNYKTVEANHNSEGQVVQILAINIRPANQSEGFGDELLRFFLDLCQSAGRSRVVGVTRCSRYALHSHKYSMEGYVQARNEFGQLLDPILHFHEEHGARIEKLVPAYRAEDLDNRGYGVLVSYDMFAKTPLPVEHVNGNWDNLQMDHVLKLIQNEAPSSGSAYSSAKPFLELGFDSADLSKLGGILSKMSGKPVSPALFFEFPTPLSMAAHITRANTYESLPPPKKRSRKVKGQPTNSNKDGFVAVIGMDCHFPGGATGLDLFWNLLISGQNAITDLPDQPRFGGPEFQNLECSRGGYLEGVDLFDSHFFHVSPAEARLMDPQHRLLLQSHWRALEHSGISPKSLHRTDTGVFVGMSSNDYALILRETEHSIHVATGTAPGAAAGRISYFFGLNGPAMVIDTACSSSLVALHYAASSLLQGECSLAFASGVNLILQPGTTSNFHKAGMLSPDGTCKVFDEGADGYGRSEGVGVVLLKKLEDAKRDGNSILGIIRGSAVGQSEDRNGLTAPSVRSQLGLYAKAFRNSGLSPLDVSYVEAHGTGTPLGDLVEWESLQRFYTQGRSNANPLLLGSVKSVVGHCEAAAGICGLIKLILSLEAEQLPPNSNFKKLNPKLENEEGKMVVVAERTPWIRDEKKPRVASVSSFGFSGTIAHVLIEEGPESEIADKNREKAAGVITNHLVTLSAPVASNLQPVLSQFLEWIGSGKAENLKFDDIAYTSTVCRPHFAHRLAFIASSTEELQAELKEKLHHFANSEAILRSPTFESGAELVFVFSSNQGDGRTSDVQATYENNANFRQKVEEVDLSLMLVTGQSLAKLLDEGVEQFEPPAFTAIQICWARFCIDLGIHPSMIIGEGCGEFAAGHIASIISLEDAIRLAVLATLKKSTNGDIGDDEVVAITKATQLQPVISYWSVAEGCRMDTVGPHHWNKVLTASDVLPLSKLPPSVYSDFTLKFAVGIPAIYDDEFIISPSSAAEDPLTSLLTLIRQLYLGGITPNFELLETPTGKRHVELPGYPFQKKRHWIHSENTEILVGMENADSTPGDESTLSENLEAISEMSTDVPMFYKEVWLQDKTPAMEIRNSPENELTWLAFTLSDELSAELTSKLPNVICVNSTDLSTPAAFLTVFQNHTNIAGILHLLSIGSTRQFQTEGEMNFDLKSMELFISTSLLHLVQGLTQSGLSVATRIIVVTQNTVGDLGEGELNLNLVGSSLWGLTQTLRREIPELDLVTVDVPSENQVEYIQDEMVGMDSEETKVAYNALGVRHLKRLLPVTDLPPQMAPKFDRDETFLVTGAFGRLGLELIQWMIDNGANHFALVGCHMPPPDMINRLRFLQTEYGVKLLIGYKSNLDTLQGTKKLFDDLRQANFPEVTGIFHLAGTSDDGNYLDQNPAKFKSVYTPKAFGAWHLHLATKDLKLRWFVLFSSAAGFLGYPGQSSYAGASTFLDALAAYRHRLDLPATSIAWGPIGMEANNVGFGLESMPLSTAWNALGTILANPIAQIAVTPFNWDTYAELHGKSERWLSEISMLQSSPPELKLLPPCPPASPTTPHADIGSVKEKIRAIVAALLGLGEDDELDDSEGFQSLGMDSLDTVNLTNRIAAKFKLPFEIPATAPFDYPNINMLSTYVSRLIEEVMREAHEEVAAMVNHNHAGSRRSSPERPEPDVTLDPTQTVESALPDPGHEKIAIIGMSCRFPEGASSLEGYWEILKNGANTVRKLPRGRWNLDEYYDPDPSVPGKMYTQWGSFLENVTDFDAKFFNISPREMETLDPQQILLLEQCWEALERAGIPPLSLSETPTGVFVGICSNDTAILHGKDEVKGCDGYFESGTALSTASGRVSHFFGFQGPSLSVDAACASSLVAVHLAVQSLRLGESRMALAGGVNLILSPHKTVVLCKSQMLSSDGQCKTFDADANGFVRGEGVGILVLKLLQNAINDHDNILAVISGTALTHSGPSSGLTVPNVSAQVKVVNHALAVARIGPGEVDYLETHGTGTSLGDPIECRALQQSFFSTNQRPASSPLTIGTCKVNIGHLEGAAGIAGIIKVILALQHEWIPPHRNFRRINPHIKCPELFDIPLEGREWKSGGDRRRVAGVSSFGFSGSNAHVIVEEFDDPRRAPTSDMGTGPPAFLLAVSAKSQNALQKLLQSYKIYFENPEFPSDDTLADVTYTANVCRSHFRHRAAFIMKTKSEYAELYNSEKFLTRKLDNKIVPKIAFLFTGQGASYARMGAQLYKQNPTFRETVDMCNGVFRNEFRHSLLETFFADTSNQEQLKDPRFAQPGLFTLQVSLARMWKSLGVEPNFVIGHSIGEYAAAEAAGIFSLEEGMRLICRRSQLIYSLPADQGGMMAVASGDAKRITEIADSQHIAIDVAARNSPSQIVISGKKSELGIMGHALRRHGIGWTPLDVSHAFHSQLMDPILGDLELAAEEVTHCPPRCKFISTLTGELTSKLDSKYWRQHARQPVLFQNAMELLEKTDVTLCLELGPKPILVTLGQKTMERENITWLTTIKPKTEWETFMTSIGELYCHGIDIQFAALSGDSDRIPQKLSSLPTYAFDRLNFGPPPSSPTFKRRVSFLPQMVTMSPLNPTTEHPLLGLRVTATSNDIIYENTLCLRDQPYLEDHVVFGHVVFPMSGYLELMFAIGKAELFEQRNRSGQRNIVLKDIQVMSPFRLEKEKYYKIQVILRKRLERRLNSSYNVRILTQEENRSIWNYNATAELHLQDTAVYSPRLDVEAIKARCTSLDSSVYYKIFSNLEIAYGSSFQCVKSLWRGDKEGLSELVLAPEANHLNFLVHPVILDNTFQTLVMASILYNGNNESTYIPIGLAEAKFYSSVRGRIFAYVTWSDSVTSDLISGNCSLINEDGDVHLQTTSFMLKRTTRESLLSKLQGKLDCQDWFYAETWLRVGSILTNSSKCVVFPGELSRAFGGLRTLIQNSSKLADLQACEASLPNFESLALKYCELLLLDLGLATSLRHGAETNELVEFGRVTQEQDTLFIHILRALEADGLLVIRSDFQWKYSNFPPPERSAILNSINRLIAGIKTTYPRNLIMLGLVMRCGQEMVNVLRGERNELELLFPPNAESTGTISATQLYRESPDLRLLTKAVTTVLKTIEVEEYECLKILEVGAGTGSMTERILKTLSDRDIEFEYTFTDVSQFFLHRARENFGKYGNSIEFRLLDIEESPLSQGFLLRSWDIVVAGNVLHATKNVTTALAHIRSLLKLGGGLLIGEAIKPSLALDITFGLTSGWWRFKGHDKCRQFYPLLSGEEWKEILHRTGFEGCDYLDLSQSLIIGVASKEPPAPKSKPSNLTPWILIGDGDEVQEMVELRLADCGENVLTFLTSEVNDPINYIAFKARLEDIRKVRGVIQICLGQIRVPETPEASVPEVLYTHALLSILQTLLLEGVGIESKFLVITRSSQPVGHEGVENPFGASVWGLLRSIRREYPEVKFVNLDLSGSSGFDDLTDQILAEIYVRDSEVQIAIREKNRYVLRLQQSELECGVLPLPDDISSFNLAPGEDGLLDNLSIETNPRAPSNIIGPKELKVEVVAAGINFRDVLIAMGLYPPGHLTCFGTDFSGRVIQIGQEVTDFAPGDPVIGFGENTFGNITITRPEWIIRKPGFISFETAAGIPSVFVTAYHSLLVVGKLRAGESVLIHGGGGGVGLAAIQIARHVGAKIYVTASSSAKWAYLNSLGISRIYQSRNTEFGVELESKMNMVLNSVTGEGFIEASLKSLAPGGRFLELSRRCIWSAEEMRHARPDVEYHVIELDRMLVETPLDVKSILVELMDLFASETIRQIPTQTIQFREAHKAFTLLKQSRQLGKIVLSLSHFESPAIRFREHGLYLITGGLGGLGLTVAAWLIEQGATSLVLTTRSAPTPSKLAILDKLKSESGAKVDVFLTDVGKILEVGTLFAKFSAGSLPLRGIFHCAGLLADGTILTQSTAKFEQVYNAKVYGSWYLHLASQSHVLDHFVLFSSLVSLLGPPGQSNHAAGNAFMDSLGHYRVQNGLPATVINWGPWSGVGAATEKGVTDNFGFGVKSFTPREGIICLEKVLQSNFPEQVSVSPFDWAAYFEEVGRDETWLSYISSQHSEAGREEATRRFSEISDQSEEATDFQTRYYRRRSQIQQNIAQQVSKITGLNMESIDEGEGFMDMGMDSIMALELRNIIQSKIGGDFTIPPTIAYDHPTIDSLTSYISSLILKDSAHSSGDTVRIPGPRDPSGPSLTFPPDGIAVVGMACRYGSATTPEEFWEVLSQGRDCVTVVPKSRFDIDEVYSPDQDAPGKTYSRYGSFISDVDMFEPGFFGISPKEAQLMDPQQRILLELAWEALERAAIPPDTLAGTKTGVFIGMCTNDYSDLIGSYHAYVPTGVAHSTASGRISFVYGFQGPSLSVDTACSSSLVALHLAIQSLASGDSILALVGGVNLILTPKYHINLSKAGMLSRDGRCKTFDASADGFVRGEGCGMVVLKRISDALRDKDQILAVVRGSALNQDGASASLTAPSGLAQGNLIRAALEMSRISPTQISYIEAHGTGTEVGDPIEQNALALIFGPDRTSRTPLYLGSAKVNVGHTEGAAGICGLIKTILCLQHKEIPMHRNFTTLNPMLTEFDSGVFKIPLQTEGWRVERGGVRRAGVSSFGFSGTNAHVILEEFTLPSKSDNGTDVVHYIFPFSAKTADRLPEVAQHFVTYLQESSETCSLSRLSYTLQNGRNHFKHRMAVVSDGFEDLIERCQSFCKSPPKVAPRDDPKIGFEFVSVGHNFQAVCLALYESEPVFKEILRSVDKQLLQVTSNSVIQLLLTPCIAKRDPVDDAAIRFVVQYTLAHFWVDFGIVPKFLYGNGGAEIVAATVGGFVSLEDGFRLALAYARVVTEFKLDRYTLKISSNKFQTISDMERPFKLELTWVDENQIQVEGGKEELIDFKIQLDKVHIPSELAEPSVNMQTTSKAANLVLKKYKELASTITYDQGKYLFFSAFQQKVVQNLSGDYWVHSLGKTFDRSKNIENLQQAGCNVFVQIGTSTGNVVGSGSLELVSVDGKSPDLWLSPIQTRLDFLQSIAKLYNYGITPNWSKVEWGEGVVKVRLPTYPFHKKSYWLNEPRRAILRQLRRQSTLLNLTGHTLLGKLRATTKGLQIYEQDLSTIEIEKFTTRVYNAAVIPWSTILELMISSTRQSEDSLSLSNILFQLAFTAEVNTPGNESKIKYLQTLKYDDGRVEVFSRPAGGTECKLHASAQKMEGSGSAPPTFDLEQLCKEMSPKGIKNDDVPFIFYGHDSLLIQNSNSRPLIEFAFDATVIASALEELNALQKLDGVVLVPTSIEFCTVHNIPPTIAYTYGNWVHVGSGTVMANFYAVDDDGDTVLELRNLKLEPRTSDTFFLENLNEPIVPQPDDIRGESTESSISGFTDLEQEIQGIDELEILEGPSVTTKVDLTEILQKLFKIEPKKRAGDPTFFELGLNCLSSIDYRAEIQDTLDIDIPPSTVFDYPTLSALADFIVSLDSEFQTAPSHSSLSSYVPSTILRLRSAGDQRPLFFFPNSYGTGYSWASLVKHITPGIPLYAFNNPRLHDPRNAFRSISDYAVAMVDLIRGIQPEGPYRFCGYCFGGSIALFTAKLLQEQGHQIESVTLLDTIYPTNYMRWTVVINTALAHYLLEGPIGNFLLSLGNCTLFEALNSVLMAASCTPPDYSGHVSFVRARSRREPFWTGPEYALLQTHLEEFYEAPLLGWEKSLRSVSIYSVNSDHFDMLDEESSGVEVAEILNKILEKGEVKETHGLGAQLIFAAQNNDVWLVEKLLTVLHLDPNWAEKENGWTPLHWAVKNENKEMAEILIKAGASKTLKNSDGKTPLDLIGRQLQDLFQD